TNRLRLSTTTHKAFMFDWLNQNAAAVQAVIAGVLAVVTTIYVVLTRGILRATQRRADLALVPRLSHGWLSASVVNVGEGAAVLPIITITFVSLDPEWHRETTFGPGLLAPGQGVTAAFSF